MTSFTEYKALTESYVPEEGTQYGSNEGGVYTHLPSKEKFYVKFPKNPEQAHVEAATADIYNAMGIKTLNPKVKQIEGRTALVTKWQPHIKSFTHHSQYQDEIVDPKREHELALIHHGAIITGNRDVVGLDYTNVMKDHKTGELVSADQGGSMHFRAQGENKEFGPDVKDVHSFQNPAYQSGRVFSKVSPEAFKKAAGALDSLDDEKIDSIMAQHNLGHLADVVKQRRDLLKQHYQTEPSNDQAHP